MKSLLMFVTFMVASAKSQLSQNSGLGYLVRPFGMENKIEYDTIQGIYAPQVRAVVALFGRASQGTRGHLEFHQSSPRNRTRVIGHLWNIDRTLTKQNETGVLYGFYIHPDYDVDFEVPLEKNQILNTSSVFNMTHKSTDEVLINHTVQNVNLNGFDSIIGQTVSVVVLEDGTLRSVAKAEIGIANPGTFYSLNGESNEEETGESSWDYGNNEKGDQNDEDVVNIIEAGEDYSQNVSRDTSKRNGNYTVLHFCQHHFDKAVYRRRFNRIQCQQFYAWSD